MVMMLINKIYPNNFWDVKEALMVQNSFDDISIFWIFGLGFLGLFVFILQFL